MPAAALVTVCCLPYILSTTPSGTLRTLRVAFFPPVAAILFAVTFAWTPGVAGGIGLQDSRRLPAYAILIVAGLVHALITWFCVDPIVSSRVPSYFPVSPSRLVLALPWVSMFQPLFLVAGVYAFAYRLSTNGAFAVAAVSLAHEGFLFMQYGSALPAPQLAILVLVTGMYGLMQGCLYTVFGLPGPFVLALLSYSRHALRFL